MGKNSCGIVKNLDEPIFSWIILTYLEHSANTRQKRGWYFSTFLEKTGIILCFLYSLPDNPESSRPVDDSMTFLTLLAFSWIVPAISKCSKFVLSWIFLSPAILNYVNNLVLQCIHVLLCPNCQMHVHVTKFYICFTFLLYLHFVRVLAEVYLINLFQLNTIFSMLSLLKHDVQPSTDKGPDMRHMNTHCNPSQKISVKSVDTTEQQLLPKIKVTISCTTLWYQVKCHQKPRSRTSLLLSNLSKQGPINGNFSQMPYNPPLLQ